MYSRGPHRSRCTEVRHAMSDSFLDAAAVRTLDAARYAARSGVGFFELDPKDAQGYGSDAMRALVSAFSDAFNEEFNSPQIPSALRILPTPSGPPPLGSILQLAKDTGKSRKECKDALVACANDCDAARALLSTSATPCSTVDAERPQRREQTKTSEQTGSSCRQRVMT